MRRRVGGRPGVDVDGADCSMLGEGKDGKNRAKLEGNSRAEIDLPNDLGVRTMTPADESQFYRNQWVKKKHLRFS